MCPQIIDEMFWPFSVKSVAERHKSLQVYHRVQMSNYILHGVDVENILVKSFHVLFCPIYALDAQLQSAGGAGPPKWEPLLRIGVYLGHSLFHSDIVALMWNPTTRRVGPQYHVLFDDGFTTVPYMKAGTIPPN